MILVNYHYDNFINCLKENKKFPNFGISPHILLIIKFKWLMCKITSKVTLMYQENIIADFDIDWCIKYYFCVICLLFIIFNFNKSNIIL